MNSVIGGLLTSGRSTGPLDRESEQHHQREGEAERGRHRHAALDSG